MPIHQCGGKIRRPRPARTGDPVSINQKNAVGHRFNIRKFLNKIMVMIPAYTASPPAQQTGPRQNERARAYANQRHASRGCLFDIGLGRGVNLGTLMQKPADNRNIIKMAGRNEFALRQYFNSATGLKRLSGLRHHNPFAQNRTGAIPFIGRQAQCIHKGGKGGQCEMIGQNKAHPQPRRWHRPRPRPRFCGRMFRFHNHCPLPITFSSLNIPFFA